MPIRSRSPSAPAGSRHSAGAPWILRSDHPILAPHRAALSDNPLTGLGTYRETDLLIRHGSEHRIPGPTSDTSELRTLEMNNGEGIWLFVNTNMSRVTSRAVRFQVSLSENTLEQVNAAARNRRFRLLHPSLRSQPRTSWIRKNHDDHVPSPKYTCDELRAGNNPKRGTCMHDHLFCARFRMGFAPPVWAVEPRRIVCY